MNKDLHYFHFSLGPVQSFIAQARRTRDFWAGSFLLSWLSGVAMLAVTKQKGAIIFPRPPQEYPDWINGKGTGQAPRQGGIPNRFLAEVDGTFDPLVVVQAVKLAWKELSDSVWDGDKLVRYATQKTKPIWDRQVDYFWEIQWAVGESPDEVDLLERRKNWRVPTWLEEPGIKCNVMDGWQELSGVESPIGEDYGEQLDRFWEGLRSKVGLDLRENEKLCALAWIKRRFAHHFHKVNKTLSLPTKSGATIQIDIQGWKLKTGVPSVVYLSVVPWLCNVIRNETAAALKALHDAAVALAEGNQYGEWDSNIRCIADAYASRNDISWHLAALDGSAFLPQALDDERRFPDRAKAQAMKNALSSLDTEERPSPFYAVVLMDGDELGKNLARYDMTKKAKLAEALNVFTRAAQGKVDDSNGFLVYAGGDDVLAILPLDYALECVAKLRIEYAKAMRDQGFNEELTISSAVVYAHCKVPLGKVLQNAHELLKVVAKDGCGRNGVAVRVLVPGGAKLEWSQALEKNTDNIVIRPILAAFQQNIPSMQTQFSSKFFYKMRENLALFNWIEDVAGKRPSIRPVLDEMQAATFMAAQYLSSGVNENRREKLTIEDAKRIVQPLMNLCQLKYREYVAGGYRLKPLDFTADGALLVRFLAQKEMPNE